MKQFWRQDILHLRALSMTIMQELVTGALGLSPQDPVCELPPEEAIGP